MEKTIIAVKIRELRESLGVSQGELAERMDVPPSHVSRWERERRPQLERLQEIERALSVPRGTILRMSGFVDTASEDVVEQLILDVRLRDEQRNLLIDAYEATVRRNGFKPRPHRR